MAASLDAPAVVAAFRFLLGQGVNVTLGKATGFVPSLFGLDVGLYLLWCQSWFWRIDNHSWI